jgi:predicted nucleic acid-binding protein
VELIADTTRGRALRSLLPGDAVPWVPETFYLEVGAVLRRWDLNAVLTPDRIREALRQLAAWPLRVTQVRSLFADAWRHRRNLTFADATYVALAEHLDSQDPWRDRRRAACRV